MFGISSHLFHGERLARRHLDLVAAAGFARLEVFATRTHFDYHAPEAIASLRMEADTAGVRIGSLHAPICESFVGGVWGRAFSNASRHAPHRDEAVAETLAAIEAAKALGCDHVVLHIGLPRGQPIPADDNDLASARRALDPIAAACVGAGVQLALEIIPNDLATPSALTHWLTGEDGFTDAAICLDTGHAHLMGGAPDAIDVLGGHIVTTHLHDNRGHDDTHLVPFAGTIDWTATMTAFVKAGFNGPYIFELPDHGDAEATLQRAVGVRNRLQAILDGLAEPFPFTEG